MGFLAPVMAPLLGTGAATAAGAGGTAAATGAGGASGLGSLLGVGGEAGTALNSMGILGLEKMANTPLESSNKQQESSNALPIPGLPPIHAGPLGNIGGADPMQGLLKGAGLGDNEAKLLGLFFS